jgi:hypothetical protein
MRFERDNAQALHLPPDHVAALDRAFAQAAYGQYWLLHPGSYVELTSSLYNLQRPNGLHHIYHHHITSSRNTSRPTTTTVQRHSSPKPGASRQSRRFLSSRT